MTGFPNLAGQADVYGLRDIAHEDEQAIEQAVIKVTVERSPTALAQVFGLLCTFSVVPEAVRSDQPGGEFFTVSLTFANFCNRKFDLLNRKLSQLTETIEVNRSHCD